MVLFLQKKFCQILIFFAISWDLLCGITCLILKVHDIFEYNACSLIIECRVLYMFNASNILTVLFKSPKMCWFIFAAWSISYSIECTKISHYYWSLTMALPISLHYTLYIWGNVIIYTWICNYHIFQLNCFLLFCRNFFILMGFFIFIWMSQFFFFFFILLLSTSLCHCILVVWLGKKA